MKEHKHLFLLFFFGLATVASYIWFINSPYFDTFVDWSQRNLLIYFLVLSTLKIIGIVWPPLPGGLLTLGSIPVLGWPLAYSADLLGSLIGSTIAYLLARKYGLGFMKKIFDEETIQKLTKVKIKPSKELESIFLLRFFGGTIVEVVCYGAGLLKVKFKNYLMATILSHMALGIPAFFLIRNLFTGKGFVINFIFMASLFIIFYKLRDRYFTFGESKNLEF